MNRSHLRGRFFRNACLILLFLALLARQGGAQGVPYLVKDINPNNETSAGSNPQKIVALGGVVFFTANDGIHGAELWKTDGTRAGTVMVRDIWPGPQGSNPMGLASIRGKLYFTANDGVHGYEPWISDGTVAGTHMILDVAPGVDSATALEFIDVNGQVFFHPEGVRDIGGSWHTDYGYLWKTDGTAAGTVLVRNVCVPSRIIDSTPPTAANVNGSLYFIAGKQFGLYPTALWKSDGTSAGTVMIMEVYKPSNLFACNGALFFMQDLYGLQRSDGTAAGTGPFFQFGPINKIRIINGKMLVSAAVGYDRFALWLSDGTTSGTRMISSQELYTIYDFAALGGSYYYLMRDKLMRCDESGNGSQQVKTLPATYPWHTSEITVSGGKLYFIIKGEGSLLQLWRSDGTEAGTVPIREFTQIPASSYPSRLLTAVQGKIFFRIDDSIHGTEPWVSDGSAAGTRMLRDIRAGADSDPANLTASGGHLYLTANDGAHGSELWTSNGTGPGTVLVKDIWTTSGANPGDLTDVNGTLYFKADDGVTGEEIWKTNGTAAGTMQVKDLNAGMYGCGAVGLFSAYGKLFFSAYAGTNRTLWMTDGTAAGTIDVPSAGVPVRMAMSNGIAYAANESKELWKCYSTGTASLVKKFDRPINDMIPSGSDLYVATDQLWITRGSESTTELLKSFSPYILGTEFNGFAVTNGKLHFIVDPLGAGPQIWKSDATAGGTLMMMDFSPADPVLQGTYLPHSPVSAGGNTFFVASVYGYGPELWKSNGTGAGTALLKDIYPGETGSDPQNLIAVGGMLYFTATDPVHGTEIWRSNGTPEGTRLFAEVSAGVAGSAPAGLTAIGDLLYFTAINADGNEGRELWAVDLKAANGVKGWAAYTGN